MAATLTRTRRQPFTHAPEGLGLRYRALTFSSRTDELRLERWLLLPDETQHRAVVLAPGLRQDRQSELAGRFLELAASLVATGRPILLFDNWGTGHSEGDRIAADLYLQHPADGPPASWLRSARVAPGRPHAGSRRTHTPLLVIHGDADSFVPVSHGRRLATAYGPGVETMFVAGAGHVEAYATESVAYVAHLTGFFDRHASGCPR